MASFALEQILGYVPLTKSIQATTMGIPKKFPESFFRTKDGDKVIGNKARYVRVTGERRTARRVEYGSPALKADLRPIGEVDVVLNHLYEELPLDVMTLKYLRDKESYEYDKTLSEVTRQVQAFATKFANTRIASVARVLKAGVLYWDNQGNFLPSSSGAFQTHSFQMSANNQNQLNGIISASWATPTTDIPLQLRLLKKQAVRQTGYPLKYAFYGENIPTYLTNNNYVIEYLARNNTMQTKWLESDGGEIPDGLFGYTWVPVYESFFEDSAGTNQDLWDADAVTFTPDPEQPAGMEWWRMMEGSFEVPTTINVMTDAEAAVRSTKTIYGMGGYSLLTPNPVRVAAFTFDTFLPILANPDVIFQADVTP